jgi:hypothetical protein
LPSSILLLDNKKRVGEEFVRGSAIVILGIGCGVM